MPLDQNVEKSHGTLISLVLYEEDELESKYGLAGMKV